MFPKDWQHGTRDEPGLCLSVTLFPLLPVLFWKFLFGRETLVEGTVLLVGKQPDKPRVIIVKIQTILMGLSL